MFLFLFIYNLPKTDDFAFVDQIDFVLDAFSDANLPVIACSGFNSDFLKDNNLRYNYLDNVEKQWVCSNIKNRSVWEATIEALQITIW